MDILRSTAPVGRRTINNIVAVAFLAAVFLANTARVNAADSLAATAPACVPQTAAIDALLEIGSVNRCPVANAGQDLTIPVNQAIPLDARATSDADGDRLQFHWVLARAPAGSTAQPAEPHALKTEFVADMPGDYVFELTATDARGASAVDTVRFSTGKIAPVANAGPDISAALGEVVNLDAARSYDLDGSVLSYRWRVLERPQASRSVLSGQDDSRAALFLDADGDYLVELVVSDDRYASVADTLRISTVNSRPVADAGRLRTMAPDSTLVLDGAGSIDADGDALSYHWAILSSPHEADIKLQEAHSVSPQLRVGAEGLYLFQLMVDDGVYVSAPATVLVEVKRERLENYNREEYLALVSRGGGDDSDGDGVPDLVDNCVSVANAPQRDTDGDGIGNFCDPDLNNDGVVNFLDIGIWQTFFLSSDPDADFDGSGAVNFLDYSIITSYFLSPPGPPGAIIWVSLVDGDWDDRLNWDPQVVPTAGTTAIIDVAPAVTVTKSSGSATVKTLMQNEALVLSFTTFEATAAVELGGTISGTGTTINNTSLVPSLAGSGTVTLNSGTHTWSANTLGVDVVLNNGAVVNNSNGVTVNATVTIDAPSSPTGITFLNTQTMDGTGTIFINGVGNGVITEPRLLPGNSTTLTIASGLTIEGGKGRIGQPFADLILNANVNANAAGEALQISASTWSGSATLTASNGGLLQLTGNFDNGGNPLGLDTASGGINLIAGASLRNATINGTAGTNLTMNTGSTNLQSLVFNADMTLVNGAIVNVSDGLTMNGDVLINAPASPTGFTFTNTQTLGGTGTITIDGTGNGVITEPRLLPGNSTTLTIGAGITIQGGKGTIGQPFADLVLSGNVFANVAGEALQISASNWSSTATLTAINGGLLRLSGNFDNGSNPVSLDTAGGAIDLLAGASLRNAIINGTAGTDLTMNAGTTNLQAVVFNADMTFVNGALTNVTDGLTINGEVLINAPSSPTGFQFTGSQTLDGTSTITINATGNGVVSEARLFPGNSTTLTIGSDITINGGTGTIGQAFANLVFLGDLICDRAGEEILIGGSSWSANSSIQTINDGEVRFYGTMNNGGSALSLDAADGVATLTSGVTLNDAVFNGTPGTNLIVSPGTTTMTAMTFNHDLTHQNGAITNVGAGLTINGTSTIVAPSSPTGYQFTGSQSLLGTANILFDSAGNSVISEPRLFPGNSTVLTIGPSVSIRGGNARIGQPFAAIVVSGSVNANVSGAKLQLSGSGWSGTGTVAATNGGIIELQGNFDNGDQTINYDTADGSIEVLSGSAMRNAVIAGTAGTDFGFNSGFHTFQNMTFNADLTINNGAVITTSEGLTLNGTALIDAPSSTTGFTFTGSQTLGGSGTVIIDGIGNGVITEPRLFPANSTVLTIGSGIAIRGGVGTIGQAFASVIVNGSISADTGTLSVLGTTAGVTNNGLLEAINGQTLTVDNLGTSEGDLHAGAGSLISLPDPLPLSAGSDVFIDIGGPALVGQVASATGTSAYAGTLTVSAVDGYMPNVSDSFVIFSHAGFSGGFASVAVEAMVGVSPLLSHKVCCCNLPNEMAP